MTERKQANASFKRYLIRRIQLGAISALLVGIAALAMSIAYQRMNLAGDRQSISAQSISIKDAAQDFDGTIAINPPVAMPDFTLRDQFNQSVSLRDLRGKYVLITFGYTNCPDICPLTLSEFRSARQALGAPNDVAFLFISVDGERDSPAVLQNYFALRGLDGIIGLSGEEEAIRALGIDYGLTFEMTAADEYGGYLVNHTAGSFLLDPDGRWIRRYQFGAPTSDIVADLKGLLAA